MKSILLLSAALCSGIAVADNVPALKDVTPRPRLGRTNVAVRVGGAMIRPTDFTVRRSLSGKWKFKGLDRQAMPFGPTLDSERAILSPRGDDKAWMDIKVPLNWWTDSRFSYGKTFDPKELYFRGYYRRTFNVSNPADGKRRFLRFEEIGAEAEIYVNGSLAGWHAGDFVPCEFEITPFLKPGENLVGVRVLADLGPTWHEGKRIFTRPYGANWNHTVVKGGIWHDVFLDECGPVRISDVRIDPAEDFSSIRMRGTIDSVGPGGTFQLSAAIVEDVPGAPACEPSMRMPLALKPGMQAFDIVVPAKGARPWSPDDPNLYWAALVVSDASGHPVSARLDRFGFRTMRIDGTRFMLNGKPIYLVGDSLHSVRYGGRGGEPAVEVARRGILAHKANGANTLRTAHMPAIPEVYDLADEIGMMIYDEWCNSFCNRIDEKEFERNNLPGLEAFIRRDYNHASVVLWSLGNEVVHHSPEVARQLDRQYDLVKRLDGQNRPACAFSGVANVWVYGCDKLKTDFIDSHDYLGIDSDSWTDWFRRSTDRMAQMCETYGEDGVLKIPLVMWECVGAGWCIKNDDGMKPGDVARYVDWAGRKCAWSVAEGIPFSAAVGLLPILDSARGRYYVQGYLAARLCELFRQDRRLAGFAPWFADPGVPGCTRWTQQVYPLLRNNARDDGRLMFRQLSSPDVRTLECAVVNDTDAPLDDVSVSVSLSANGREIPLATCEFGRIGVFEEGVQTVRLTIPDGLSGDGEMRLRLSGPGGLSAMNGYRVRLHPEVWTRESALGGRELALAVAAPETERILDDIGIGHSAMAIGAEWPEGGTVVVPPGAAYDADRAERFVRGGGALFVLEPVATSIPGFPELFVLTGANHLVEPVLPTHPAFDGLSAADFDTWAERPFGAPVTSAVHPFGMGVLAARPRYIRGDMSKYGMALCEYRIGKGRLIVSTVEAEGVWGKNPAATRYLRNLLEYASGGAFTPDAPVFDEIAARPVPADVSADPLVLVGKGVKNFSLSFPGCATNSLAAPYKILFFREKRAKLAAGGYRYLAITFCSKSNGYFDVTIPKDDHRNRLFYTIPAAISKGRYVTVRLSIEKDFRFACSETFGMDQARGEIIFYNGRERDEVPPFPRPPVDVEISEMRFE